MKRKATSMQQPDSDQPDSDSEEAAETQPQKRSKPRRQSSALRKQMKERGAFYLTVMPLKKLLNPFQRSPDAYDLSKFPVAAPTDDKGGTSQTHQQDLQQLLTVLRKGVVVTRDTGCLIPHEQYCQRGAGPKTKGYQKFAAVVYGWSTDGGNQTGVGIQNEFGWDCAVEASHLCHRHQCMNPAHLVYEAAWRIRKRNYCGLRAPAGACDCGNEPRCLLRYEPDTTYDQLIGLNCADVSEVESIVLEPLKAAGIPISCDRPSGVTQRDAKSDQRKAAKEKRVNAAGKQAYASAKKAAQRTAKQLAVKEAAKAGLHSPEAKQAIAEASEKAYLKHLKPDGFLD